MNRQLSSSTSVPRRPVLLTPPTSTAVEPIQQLPLQSDTYIDRVGAKSLSRRGLGVLVTTSAFVALQTSLGPSSRAEEAVAVASSSVPEGWKVVTSSSKDPGFRIAYPPDWVVAFDRTAKQNEGTLLLGGNFKTATTAGVSVAKIPDDDLISGLDLKLILDGTATPRRVAEALTAETSSAASTLGFYLQSAERVVKDGRTFFSFEYVVDICRGEIIEGKGGNVQCLGQTGAVLPVVKRKVRGLATIESRKVILLSSAGPLDNGIDEGIFKQIFGSFEVASS